MQKVTRTITASRSVTLDIGDWARLEEIRLQRGLQNFREVIAYVIKADHAFLKAKLE